MDTNKIKEEIKNLSDKDFDDVTKFMSKEVNRRIRNNVAKIMEKINEQFFVSLNSHITSAKDNSDKNKEGIDLLGMDVKDKNKGKEDDTPVIKNILERLDWIETRVKWSDRPYFTPSFTDIISYVDF